MDASLFDSVYVCACPAGWYAVALGKAGVVWQWITTDPLGAAGDLLSFTSACLHDTVSFSTWRVPFVQWPAKQTIPTLFSSLVHDFDKVTWLDDAPALERIDWEVASVGPVLVLPPTVAFVRVLLYVTAGVTLAAIPAGFWFFRYVPLG